MAFDSKGNLYVSIYMNGDRIYKITGQGATPESWYTATDNNPDGTFEPGGIAIDHRDNLFIANEPGKNIVMITPEKVHGIVAGDGTGAATANADALQGSVFFPRTLAIDKYGDIYILGSGANTTPSTNPGTIQILGRSMTQNVVQSKKHELLSNASAYQLANNERSDVVKSVQLFDTVDPNFNIAAGELKPLTRYGYNIGSQPGTQYTGYTAVMDALGNIYTPAIQSPWKMYKTTPAGVTTEFLTHSNLDIRSMTIDSTGNAYFEGRTNGWSKFYKIPGTTSGGLSSSYSVYLDFAQVNGIGANPNPAYLTADKNDDLYFIIDNDYIYKIVDPSQGQVTNSSSSAIELVASNVPVSITGIAFNKANEMFLSSWPGYIYKLVNGNFNVSQEEAHKLKIDVKQSKIVQLNKIVFDAQDNIYTVSQQLSKSNTSSSYFYSCGSSRCSS